MNEAYRFIDGRFLFHRHAREVLSAELPYILGTMFFNYVFWPLDNPHRHTIFHAGSA
jgi:hypothetical protein